MARLYRFKPCLQECTKQKEIHELPLKEKDKKLLSIIKNITSKIFPEYKNRIKKTNSVISCLNIVQSKNRLLKPVLKFDIQLITLFFSGYTRAIQFLPKQTGYLTTDPCLKPFLIQNQPELL